MAKADIDLLAIPGCEFLGFIAAKNVNNGCPVPLFTPELPPPGKPSINTPVGWNAAAEKYNLRSFKVALGRDPVNDTELHNWIKDNM